MSIFSQSGNSRLYGKHKEALDLFSAGRTKDAILALLDLAEAEPTNALVCLDIGRTVMAMGMYDQAIVAARQSLELDETSVEALMLLSEALEKTGQYADSIVALRRVIELKNDPKREVEDFLNERIPAPLTIPEYGVALLNFTVIGDASNFTLKAFTEDKNKLGVAYITIAGSGTEDEHSGYLAAVNGEFKREQLLKSLPESLVTTVGLFPGETFSYKLYYLSGVNSPKREKEIVVCYSAEPQRVSMAAKTADLLLRQMLKPDHLVLWLTEDKETGVGPNQVPERLEPLMKRGLEIRWTPSGNVKNYFIEARKEFPDALIVTADVNVQYPRFWLEQLVNAFKAEPQFVHCHCAHQVLYGADGRAQAFATWNHLAKGVRGPLHSIYPVAGAGAIYAPGHLATEMTDESAFDEFSGGNIDAWLSAMATLAGTKCKKVFDKSMDISKIRSDDTYVADASVADVCVDDHIAALARKYNVFNRKD